MSTATFSVIFSDFFLSNAITQNCLHSQTCPLLLRVFVSTAGRHHSVGEYFRGKTPSNELQIYTWLDATLKELTSLVRDVNPDTRKKGEREFCR